METQIKERSCINSHPVAAATAWRCAECASELTGLPNPIKRRGLCRHLGALRRSVECDSCCGKVSLKIYACSVRQEATLATRLRGVAAVCDECLHYSPPTSPATAAAEGIKAIAIRDTFSLVSPLGTGLKVAGVGRQPPWTYPSTAIIPHLNTPDCLPVLVDLLRLQTKAPYIIVIDTGSPFEVCDRIEQLRSDDVEIHYIRANGWGHTSEPVCVALDLGFARSMTPLMFLTHTDCFPIRRDALEWLGNQCDAATPVVGWEMSDRSWITTEWKGMVSHTFTMLHSATMRRIGASWHMQRARDVLGVEPGYQADGWPDTETNFAYCLQAASIPVKLLGAEFNGERQVTAWWDHARSYTGTRLYCPGTAQGDKTKSYAAEALVEATARVRAWRGGV